MAGVGVIMAGVVAMAVAGAVAGVDLALVLEGHGEFHHLSLDILVLGSEDHYLSMVHGGTSCENIKFE